MSMFQQPSQGDRFNVGEHLGSLALFRVHEVRQNINTPYGDKEAVACDIHILDGAKAGESFENSLIFQGGLIGSLRSAAGADPVLARLGHGVAKPGQSPPFVLLPFTDADAKLAEAWIAARPKFQAPANGNGGPTTPAAGAPQTSTAPPTAPAPPAPAPANGNGVDYSALPPEVQELLKQSGAMPR